VLWVLFWPIFWFIKIGDITGPKSWFWIIGEMNYVVAAAMPFLYKWFGFKMAVLLEAVITGYLPW